MGKKKVHSKDVALDPAAISRFKKERFVRSLSEDEFRDKIIRPLFLRKGFTDGREMCGSRKHGSQIRSLPHIFLPSDPEPVTHSDGVGEVDLVGHWLRQSTIRSTRS